MNILFVAEYYFANPDFVRLSEELAKRNQNISVATSLRAVDGTHDESNIAIFEIEPAATIYNIPHTLSFPISKIASVAKAQKINVIHAINDHSTNVATASLISKATGIPFIYTIQGPGTRTGHPLVDSLVAMYDLTFERWISRIAKRVILLSQSLRSTAQKLGVENNKIAVIPSGIDHMHFDSGRHQVTRKAAQLKNQFNIDDEVVVGFVGRLVPAKGVAYLFSALKIIQKNHSNIALLIVGEGAQRKDLELMAKDLKVRTIFAGWQRDIRPYYSLMDIFVLPSMYEGLPNVLLEAMAMKTAIVATNVGGNPDVICNGENGFLVPARSVQQLASALEKLIENDDLRTKMGTVNRQKIEEKFQWSKSVEKIEKVYNEIV